MEYGDNKNEKWSIGKGERATKMILVALLLI